MTFLSEVIMKKPTLHELIRKIMRGKKNWKSYEIQTSLSSLKRFYSESTITRRLREMPDVIAIRPKSKVIKAWDYRLIK